MEIILCVHVHPLIYSEQVRSFENGLHKKYLVDISYMLFILYSTLLYPGAQKVIIPLLGLVFSLNYVVQI